MKEYSDIAVSRVSGIFVLLTLGILFVAGCQTAAERGDQPDKPAPLPATRDMTAHATGLSVFLQQELAVGEVKEGVWGYDDSAPNYRASKLHFTVEGKLIAVEESVTGNLYNVYDILLKEEAETWIVSLIGGSGESGAYQAEFKLKGEEVAAREARMLER